MNVTAKLLNNTTQMNQTVQSTKGFSQANDTMKNFAKTIPKVIYQDQEQLYEELVHAKSTVNELIAENNGLKSTVQELKEKAVLYRKVTDTSEFSSLQFVNSSIKDMKRIKNTYTPAEKCSIVLSLKAKNRSLQDQIVQLKDQVVLLKRNIKLTSYQEMEIQLKTYKDECIRLKNLLQQAFKVKSEQTDDLGFEASYLSNMSQVQQLQAHNQQLLDRSIYCENQLKQNERIRQNIEQNLQRLTRSNVNLNKRIEEKDNENENLKNHQTYDQCTNQLKEKKQEVNFRSELEKNIQVNCNLKHEIRHLETKTKNLEKELNDTIVQSKNEYGAVKSEKDLWMKECQKNQVELNQLQSKYDEIVQQNLRPKHKNRPSNVALLENESQQNLMRVSDVGTVNSSDQFGVQNNTNTDRTKEKNYNDSKEEQKSELLVSIKYDNESENINRKKSEIDKKHEGSNISVLR